MITVDQIILQNVSRKDDFEIQGVPPASRKPILAFTTSISLSCSAFFMEGEPFFF